MKRLFAVALASIIVLSFFGCEKETVSNNFRMTASFYPMYVATLNITDGAQNVELENFTDSDYGCMHNYMFAQSDRKTLEGTRLFIASGIEMENFVGKNSLGIPRLDVIESGEDVPYLLMENDRENPHYWMNIENAISHCEKIERTLVMADPANAEVYEKNAAEYREKLEELLDEARARTEALPDEEMVLLDDTFEYFADEFGIRYKKLLSRHGTNPSEESIETAIEYIKRKKVTTVYIGKGEKSDAVRTVERETGCEVVELNILNRGRIDENVKDAYINAIRENLDVLEANMGK